MAKVFLIGQAVLDLVFRVDELPSEARKYTASGVETVGGGCAANAAVAIARLGGEAWLSARVGDDPAGELIRRDLEAEGVNLSCSGPIEGGVSARSSITIDPAGERQILNFKGDGLGERVEVPEERFDAALADSRWSHGARRALSLGTFASVPRVLDAEVGTSWSLACLATHVVFSRDGLLDFSSLDDLPQALFKANRRVPGWVAVTDGKSGLYHLAEKTGEGSERILNIPAPKVEAVDTLGAGDVWHGAFTLGLAQGKAEVEAARFASAAAALKCARHGGGRACPSLEEVESFMGGAG